MSRRKLNMFPWSAGLAAVLIVLGLMGAVGVSYARYQVNRSESIFYTPRQPEQIYLGQMIDQDNGKAVFDPQKVGSWETVEGKSQLTFAVANGTSGKSYTQQDQQVQIRLVGSLGIWDGEKTVNVLLRVPREAKPDETEPQFDEIRGKATRILKDSPMFSVFGEGWVFTFPDEDGKEMTWLLEGGSLPTISCQILIDGIELTDPSLLQLTVTGYFAPEEP